MTLLDESIVKRRRVNERKYKTSEKGHATRRKYWAEKGRPARRVFNSPEERQLAKKLYMQKYGREYARTEKRRAVKRRYNQLEHRRAIDKIRTAQWRDGNRELLRVIMKTSDLKRHFGLTPETWNALFVQQGSACAVCGNKDSGRKNGQWSTDHDHNREDLHARGILCNGCNLMLGHAKDSIPRLQAAIKYLEKHLGSP